MKHHRSIALAILIAALLAGQAPAQLPGYEIVPITNDTHWQNRAWMNECGEIVFATRFNNVGVTQEIFLYDNGKLSQLTDNDVPDAFPTINDSGLIVWTHDINALNIGTIQMYDNGVVTELAIGSSSQVNNLGHILFKLPLGSGCANGNSEIHLYDGDGITLVTDGATSNQAQEMNNQDDIVWVRFDFCQNPWQSEIMLYVDGEVTQLTTGLFQPNAPAINNVGQITFTNKYAADGGGYESALKLWENGRIRTITDWGRASKINDNSVIAFNRWHDDNETWQVWIYIEEDFFQLTDDPFWNFDGEINNAGEIAFHAGNVPFTDIKYMRRIRTGEADFDGHIDLKDAAAFQNCMTGPGDFDGIVGGFDRLCDCRFLDIDHDRDVDRDDYALFAAAMTGPQ